MEFKISILINKSLSPEINKKILFHLALNKYTNRIQLKSGVSLDGVCELNGIDSKVNFSEFTFTITETEQNILKQLRWILSFIKDKSSITEKNFLVTIINSDNIQNYSFDLNDVRV